MEFWKGVKHFPTIQKLARKMFAMPACEISYGRTFPGAGRAMSPNSTLLGAGTLSQMVYIKENLKLK